MKTRYVYDVNDIVQSVHFRILLLLLLLLL